MTSTRAFELPGNRWSAARCPMRGGASCPRWSHVHFRFPCRWVRQPVRRVSLAGCWTSSSSLTSFAVRSRFVTTARGFGLGRRWVGNPDASTAHAVGCRARWFRKRGNSRPRACGIDRRLGTSTRVVSRGATPETPLNRVCRRRRTFRRARSRGQVLGATPGRKSRRRS